MGTCDNTQHKTISQTSHLCVYSWNPVPPFHCTVEGTEAQRRRVTIPGSHGKWHIGDKSRERNGHLVTHTALGHNERNYSSERTAHFLEEKHSGRGHRPLLCSVSEGRLGARCSRAVCAFVLVQGRPQPQMLDANVLGALLCSSATCSLSHDSFSSV